MEMLHCFTSIDKYKVVVQKIEISMIPNDYNGLKTLIGFVYPNFKDKYEIMSALEKMLMLSI